LGPEHWRRVDQLCHAALRVEEGRRAAFLVEACGGDRALQQEVESLLAHAEKDSFLATSAIGAMRQAAAPHASAIGRYRIIRLLGEGGMGVVYEAEQDQPRRTVALKVIRPGFATPETLRRFQHESQALGRLQHPGIAQIYEASTADTGFGPQPYFAMELIRGEALVEYAEAHNLDTRERLALMAKICDAADHAHQRGVIHRDLKPGNILVDETGQPKILDFGVARVTESESQPTRQTDLGQLVGTLAYMSPEQVAGDPGALDLRSDVYALGVIAYELLAGKLPYHIGRKPLHEAVAIIREEEPAPLGSIDRRYRGDIGTIAGKALEKDKARRYASAADLAADIRRYLADQPIAARPASAGYQLQKFTRRHKALVAAAAAVFAVLAAGVVASTREAVRARKAESAAVEQRDRAAAAERLALVQKESARKERDRAIGAEARAQHDRGTALFLKRRAAAEAATAEAVNDFLRNDILAQAGPEEQARPDVPFDPELKLRTALDRAAARIAVKFANQPVVEASIRHTIGVAYTQLGLFPQGEQHLRRALDLRRRALGEENPLTLATMKALAQSLYRYQHRFVEAEPLYAKVLELQRRAPGTRPDTLDTMDRLGDLYRHRGDYAEAEPLLAGAVDGFRRLGRTDSPAALSAMNNLGVLYLTQRRYALAEPLLAAAESGFRKLLGDENPETLTAARSLASVYQFQGKLPEAETILVEVLQARRRVLGNDHPRTRLSIWDLAQVYRREGKLALSEPLLAELAAAEEHFMGRESPYTRRVMQALEETYELEGKYADAEMLLARLLEIRRRTAGPKDPQTALVLGRLGEVRYQQKRYEEAEKVLREALAGEGPRSGTWEPAYWRSLLGVSLARQNKCAEAEPLLVEGYQGMLLAKDQIEAIDRHYLDRARQWLVEDYEACGKPEEAAKLRQK